MRNILQPVTLDYSNLVGIPYSEANCFEIVKRFYAITYGIELYSYHESVSILDDRKKVQSLIHAATGNFTKVLEPEYGDIIVIKLLGLECHVGVYVGGGMFLHSIDKESTSTVERISRWEKRISGYYRLKDLKCSNLN